MFMGTRQQVEKRPEPIKRQGTASRAIEGMFPLVTYRELGLFLLGQTHPERLSFLTSFEFYRIDGRGAPLLLISISFALIACPQRFHDF